MKASGTRKTDLPAGQTLTLTDKGREEAAEAGKALKKEGFVFDLRIYIYSEKSQQNIGKSGKSQDLNIIFNFVTFF